MQKTWVKRGAQVVGAAMGVALVFGATGLASANHRSSTDISVSNSANITNVSTAVANTGFNSARKFSAIFTGDAVAFTTTVNIVNTTFIRIR